MYRKMKYWGQSKSSLSKIDNVLHYSRTWIIEKKLDWMANFKMTNGMGPFLRNFVLIYDQLQYPYVQIETVQYNSTYN